MIDSSLYPPEHQFGTEVPSGGAMCGNCKYVVKSDKEYPKCSNHGFIKWNRGEYLPLPPERWCCDNWEHEESKI